MIGNALGDQAEEHRRGRIIRHRSAVHGQYITNCVASSIMQNVAMAGREFHALIGGYVGDEPVSIRGIRLERRRNSLIARFVWALAILAPRGQQGGTIAGIDRHRHRHRPRAAQAVNQGIKGQRKEIPVPRRLTIEPRQGFVMGAAIGHAPLHLFG